MENKIEEIIDHLFDTVYKTGEQPNLNKKEVTKALQEYGEKKYREGWDEALSTQPNPSYSEEEDMDEDEDSDEDRDFSQN